MFIEHGEFRDSGACVASLIPQQQRDEPSWAGVRSAPDDDLPQQECGKLPMPALDLTELPHA